MFSNTKRQFSQLAEKYSACGIVFEKPLLSLLSVIESESIDGRQHSLLI